MARSRRHTPIIGSAFGAPEQQDKRWASRIHRSATRRIVKRDTDPDATVLPTMREVSDEWVMAKDGRSWFGHYFSKLMRK